MTLGQNSADGFSGGDYLTEDTVLRSYALYPTKKRRCCHIDGDSFTIIGTCFSILTVAITVALIIQIHYGNPEVTPHGAVATDEEECSRVGITIMRDGGSAVDVSIASILCMAVVHPHTVGPGGSGVMLIRDHKTNTSTVLDFMSGVPRSHKHDDPQPHETGFYAIEFGVEEIEALRAKGSEIHVKDFEDYQVRERPCIHILVQNRSLYTAPAPFGGPQLLTAVHLLRNSNITHFTTPSTLYHYFIEAIRRSYAGFIKLASANETDLQNLTELLLTSTSGESLDSSVSHADTNIPRFPEQAASSISVIDTFDQYVTSIVGLGTYFGSRMMTKHGILFNNHLANMLPHTHPDNTQHSHARPVTSYTPVIITDSTQVCGRRVVLGSPEVGAAVQVVGQMVFQDYDLTRAIEQPRITVKPGINQMFVEDLRNGDPILGSVRNELEAMNYTFQILHLPYASVNGIAKLKDTLLSWSDARGGGVAHRLEPAPKHTENITNGS
nr:glutathione hydrolase 7-like isoform X2 [Procambarus clarkii]